MIYLPHRRKAFRVPGSMLPLAWWDTSAESTITESAGSVSQLDDRSGNSNHLAQPLAGDQPETGAAVINNLNVLNYQNDVLKGPDLYGGSADAISAYVVMRENTRNGSLGVSWCAGQSGELFTLLYLWSDGKWYWKVYGWTDGVTRVSVAAPAVGTPTLIKATWDKDGDIFLSVNGSTDSAPGYGSTVTNLSQFWLGFGATNQDYGEVLLFDRILTVDEDQELMDYLSNKWGF